MGPFLPGQLPLAELASMISINNIHADTPVFMLSTASGIWTPLQKSDFEKWVNSTLEALGLDSTRPSIPSILSVEDASTNFSSPRGTSAPSPHSLLSPS